MLCSFMKRIIIFIHSITLSVWVRTLDVIKSEIDKWTCYLITSSRLTRYRPYLLLTSDNSISVIYCWCNYAVTCAENWNTLWKTWTWKQYLFFVCLRKLIRAVPPKTTYKSSFYGDTNKFSVGHLTVHPCVHVYFLAVLTPLSSR